MHGGTPPQAKGTRPRCRDTSTGTDSAHAELFGVAKRVRGSLCQADPVIRDRYAEELPALWEALAAMVEFVDEQAPPFPKPDGS